MGYVKAHSKTIDGVTYTATTLPATQGLAIFPRLVALLGEQGVALLFGAGAESFGNMMEDPKVVGALVTHIAKGITNAGGQPTDVLRDIMATCSADKCRMGDTEVQASVFEHFDEHFSGDYMHLLKVVGWIGQINFMKPSRGNH